jgi:hypothetical protein
MNQVLMREVIDTLPRILVGTDFWQEHQISPAVIEIRFCTVGYMHELLVDQEFCYCNESKESLLQCVAKGYDLTVDEVRAIMVTNDDASERRRRKVIIACLQELLGNEEKSETQEAILTQIAA